MKVELLKIYKKIPNLRKDCKTSKVTNIISKINKK